VRLMNRRSLRLKLVAGLGLALVLPLLASASSTQSISTHTSLGVSAGNVNGHTSTAVSISVVGADGLPASGAVAIVEGNRQLAGALLDSSGTATAQLTLTPGNHNLSAVYAGDTTHLASASPEATALVATSGTPSFSLSLTPVSPSSFPVTLTAGSAGTINVTVNPIDQAALTSPMFVTLSCSSLPNQALCSFSPATVQILSTTPSSCTSSSPASACPPVSTMVLQTQSQNNPIHVVASNAAKGSGTIAWAILLPGVLGLGGLAWGTRRRAWLNRLSLLALVGFITVLGTTACNPNYYYFNHGPGNVPATPSGTYTIKVTGQSSNGITAQTIDTNFVLIVQ
jgi:Bacterial Ig-like domain (group 3)